MMEDLEHHVIPLAKGSKAKLVFGNSPIPYPGSRHGRYVLEEAFLLVAKKGALLWNAARS
jgi:hypothetical protein